MSRLKLIKQILNANKLQVLPIFGDIDPNRIIKPDDPDVKIFYLHDDEE